MGRILTGRSFKSGNSVAIRMPAELGIEPGQEWTAQWVDGELRLARKSNLPTMIDISGFAGKAPGARLVRREDFDERPSSAARRAASASA